MAVRLDLQYKAILGAVELVKKEIKNKRALMHYDNVAEEAMIEALLDAAETVKATMDFVEYMVGDVEEK